jgi:hypothetical protein
MITTKYIVLKAAMDPLDAYLIESDMIHSPATQNMVTNTLRLHGARPKGELESSTYPSHLEWYPTMPYIA